MPCYLSLKSHFLDLALLIKLSLQVISAIGAAILVGGIVTGIEFLSASATSSYDITTGRGISLENAIIAFSNEEMKNRLGLKNIMVFSKSGGSSEGGQMQQILRVDHPVKLEVTESDVSFQYFVNIREDLDGERTFHCGDIRLHVFLDYKKVHITKWLGYEDRSPHLPLKTDKITIHDVPAGWHDIGLIPEARPGGCNSGYIQSWGGTGVLFD